MDACGRIPPYDHFNCQCRFPTTLLNVILSQILAVELFTAKGMLLWLSAFSVRFLRKLSIDDYMEKV